MKDPHLAELGQFPQARQSEVDPAALGLSAGEPGSRRVSGLRREDVAARVATSHDYYTRIEQGRLAPSEPVLDAFSEVLGNDQDVLITDQLAAATGAGASARSAAA